MERLGARLRFSGMKVSIAAAAAAIQLGAVTLTPFPRIPPYLPVPKDAAVIMQTGSTNTTGYRIVVTHAGTAEFIAASGRATGTIATRLATKLFADLAAASPLDQIRSQACMKSASFGTSLFVYWNHARSPDLSCLLSARGSALVDDVSAVAAQLHLNGTRGVMRPLLPGEQHRPLPTPS